MIVVYFCFFFQAEDGIRDATVTGVQTCALPISPDSSGEAVSCLACCGWWWRRWALRWRNRCQANTAARRTPPPGVAGRTRGIAARTAGGPAGWQGGEPVE